MIRPVCAVWPVTWRDLAAARRVQTAGDARYFLLEWQGGACAVCGCGHWGQLWLDHDHETDLIRGLVCASCNISEVRAETLRFGLYRARPPAEMLGLQVQYSPSCPGWAGHVDAWRERERLAGRLRPCLKKCGWFCDRLDDAA